MTAAPVLVWWLGVTPYLTVDAVRSTLSVIPGLPHVTLVFDHASPVVGADPDRRAALARRRARLEQLGEPWLSEFSPEELSDELRSAGFDRVVPVPERAVIAAALAGVRNTAGHLLSSTRATTTARGRSHLMVAGRG